MNCTVADLFTLLFSKLFATLSLAPCQPLIPENFTVSAVVQNSYEASDPSEPSGVINFADYNDIPKTPVNSEYPYKTTFKMLLLFNIINYYFSQIGPARRIQDMYHELFLTTHHGQ